MPLRSAQQDHPSGDVVLTITSDGTVLVRSGKVELGQGISTALAQIVAEELGVDISQIRMMPTITGVSPDEGYTAGSMSIQQSGAALRQQAAELRTEEATAARGLVGQSIPRLDIPGKVFGTRRYIHDLRFPGQLYGRVLRPPTRDPHNFIGVIADREEIAVQAIAQLAKEYHWTAAPTPPLPNENALPEYLTTAPAETRTLHDSGNPPTGDRSTTTIKARFSRPYLAHASIAPSCAIARWDNGTLTVWTHSQGVYNLRAELARWFNLAPEAVQVEHVEGAGCYGHNAADDAAGDAALLEQAVPGRHVQVVWSREDELTWSPFGPAMVIEVKVELNNKGEINHWRQEIWSNGHSSRPSSHGNPPLLAALSQGQKPVLSSDPPLTGGGGSARNAIPGYCLPNLTVVSHVLQEMPLRTSALRALGAHLNVYAIESIIDELAERAAQDPIEYRLSLLTDPRARKVLERVAEAAKETAPAGGDWGRGVGYARYKNTGAYCAVLADVEATDSVRVARLTIAVDVGQVVNPDGVRNQIEGGALQAVSWTTQEQVRFDRHGVTSRTWEDYPILTFADVPAVVVELVDRPDCPSLGAGEASIGPTAAAIGNAVRAALGVRVGTLPLTPANVIASLP